MNEEILKKYGMSFLKDANGSKFISNTATSYVASYISEFDDVDILDEYINDVDLCLNGQYDQIDDPTRSTPIQYARLYPSGLYWDENDFISLIDLK